MPQRLADLEAAIKAWKADEVPLPFMAVRLSRHADFLPFVTDVVRREASKSRLPKSVDVDALTNSVFMLVVKAFSDGRVNYQGTGDHDGFWASTIRHKYLDLCRQANKDKLITNASEVIESLIRPRSDKDWQMIKELRVKVQKLEDPLREVLVYRLDGVPDSGKRTHVAIAEFLGVNEKTVRRRFQSAISQLKTDWNV